MSHGAGQEKSMKTIIIILLLTCHPIVKQATAAPDNEFGVQWIEWSPQKIRNLRAEGRPIFVFYTADWDITSAINKKRVFTSQGSKKLKSKLKEHNVAIVEANWTTMSQEITDDLARFDRVNIPVTLFYPSDASQAPYILDDVLYARQLLAYIDRDSSSQMIWRVVATCLILIVAGSLMKLLKSPMISK